MRGFRRSMPALLGELERRGIEPGELWGPKSSAAVPELDHDAQSPFVRHGGSRLTPRGHLILAAEVRAVLKESDWL